MSENLPAVTSENTEELMKVLGQMSDFQGSSLPSLRINYNEENEFEEQIPKGQWTFQSGGKVVYSPECTFRIMFVRMQYSHWNREENVTTATSVYFKDFSEEIPDDAGGFKAGKVAKADFEKLPEAEKAIQKEIKLSKVLFGYVSITGKDAHDNDIVIEDEPCVFYARGTNFMPIAKYLDDLTKKNILILGVITKFSLLKKKNGSLIFWEVVPSIQEEVTLVEEDNNKIKKFADTIAAENREIVDQWKFKRNPSPTIAIDDDLPDFIVNKILE